MQKIKKSLICALLLAPALAFAEPKTADEWYKEGETQYNLGDFDKAAEAFKKGFSLETVDSKKPAYLYNVAQAYRQGQKCKDAAFFYKRYLSLKDQDTVKPLKPEKRTEIEQRISELEECAKTQETISNKPPNNTLSPAGEGGGAKTGGGTTTTGGTKTGGGTTATGGGTTVGQVEGQVDQGEGEGEGEGEGDGEGVAETATLQPRLISARFIGGGAKVNFGDLPMPVFASFALIGGYPVLVQNQLELDVGAVFAFQPVPYKNSATQEDKTGQFISVLADVGATYAVAPKIGLRGDLGVGIMAFSGISEMGNPFTEGGAATSGALTMLAVRVGVSADYAITPNLVATVMPIAFSFSPAKTGLREDASSITRLDFMLGVGYRM
jgi:tetratricopeptide (TPR) repeat protein